MLKRIIEKLFPKTYALIRLKGYDKGYFESRQIGYEQGKQQGYYDALKKVENLNVLHIDSYGITMIGDRILINTTNKT